jgi:hypothetical protein
MAIVDHDDAQKKGPIARALLQIYFARMREESVLVVLGFAATVHCLMRLRLLTCLRLRPCLLTGMLCRGGMVG